MCDVEKDGPSSDMFSFDLDKVIVDGVEEKGQRFQEYQDGHQIMDFVDWVLALP